jgi:ribonuclease Z
MDLSVFFAGTAGSIPTSRRGLPALLVRRGGDRVLFDCGEGTQRQLVSSAGLAELDAVFLTHYHADHWLGLPGLLKTFDLRGRDRPLAVHGPPGLRELLAVSLQAAGRVRFELRLVELEPGAVLDRDGYKVAAVPVAHRSLTCSTRSPARASSIRRPRSGWASSRGPSSGASREDRP